jgi:hypothetical protein
MITGSPQDPLMCVTRWLMIPAEISITPAAMKGYIMSSSQLPYED